MAAVSQRRTFKSRRRSGVIPVVYTPMRGDLTRRRRRVYPFYSVDSSAHPSPPPQLQSPVRQRRTLITR